MVLDVNLIPQSNTWMTLVCVSMKCLHCPSLKSLDEKHVCIELWCNELRLQSCCNNNLAGNLHGLMVLFVRVGLLLLGVRLVLLPCWPGFDRLLSCLCSNAALTLSSQRRWLRYKCIWLVKVVLLFEWLGDFETMIKLKEKNTTVLRVFSNNKFKLNDQLF